VDVAGNIAGVESRDIIGKRERYRGGGRGWQHLHFYGFWCDMEGARFGTELDLSGVVGGRNETDCSREQRLHLHFERSSAMI
jgi:hypothetical protein